MPRTSPSASAWSSTAAPNRSCRSSPPPQARPQAIIDLARSGEVDLYLSPFILAEVAAILTQKLGWDDDRVALPMLALRLTASVVDPGPQRLHLLADDPDNRILECALAARARYAAIDAGDPEVCAAAPVYGLDQRGHVRPGVGHTRCSIGAYEADAIRPTCTGDCSGDGVVTVDELNRGVNIALGLQPAAVCPVFSSAEGVVDIAQLVAAVNNALSGCGAG